MTVVAIITGCLRHCNLVEVSTGWASLQSESQDRNLAEIAV